MIVPLFIISFFAISTNSYAEETKLHGDGTPTDIYNYNAFSLEKLMPMFWKAQDTDFSSKPKRVPILFARGFENSSYNNCLSSSNDFPPLLTPKKMSRGGIVLPIFIVVYCFCLIAIVCDNYFIPCVEKICDALNLSEDVAAATFMSIATSAPELFVNIIGTFVTNSDIGIGTIVGSSMFNTLGVAAVGGLAASTPISIAWWPVTRDSFIYIMAVSILVAITWDGNVYWYEGLVLFVAYFVYFIIMFQNEKITKLVDKLIKKFKERKMKNYHVITPSISLSIISNSSLMPNVEAVNNNIIAEEKSEEQEYNIFKKPVGPWYKIGFFYFSWPLRFVLFCTIPDPKKYPRIFPITFMLCIIWIGINSYIVSWMIAIIGFTFGIPDAVLGLTFLAAGGCLPEAFSMAIMSRKGEGKMGISNALGANTMNILLSLGLPWFIKTLILGANNEAFINIESGSLEYTILALIFVAISLYLILYLNKFRLSRVAGAITLVIYLLFLSMAIVSDMVIFPIRDCGVEDIKY